MNVSVSPYFFKSFNLHVTVIEEIIYYSTDV